MRVKESGACMRLLALTLVLAWAALAQPPKPGSPAAAPVPGSSLPAQAIGPDDLISVSVYGAPDLNRTIRVQSDGLIRLPLLKSPIEAEGLNPAALEAAIASALREDRILKNPYVAVAIVEYHSRPISVSGAVKLPVVFQADGSTTLLSALAQAQGLREDAGREILVSQPQPGPDGKPATFTRRILVRGLIDGTDPSLNLKLHGGEEVRVPEMGKIYVVGNVKKPGVFPLQAGAETTVLQALALAEGLMPFAASQAFIYRHDDAGTKNEIPFELAKLMQRKSPDVPLMADDIIYIPQNHGKKLSAAALEKIVLFGSTAGATALIYNLPR